jgi:ADP-ribosylglycohydrolase
MKLEHMQGCLIGMALGDALGKETEFLQIEEIQERFPPNGPQELYGMPALVTDDTQMALAVGDALLTTSTPFTSELLAQSFSRTFIEWYHVPDNNRAPGMTCLVACESLIRGQSWIEASQINSKGCGANMRVMPVALLDLPPDQRAGIAQLQAAITHGHPTALVASDLTAWVIADLGNEGSVDTLMARLRHYAESQQNVYHQGWLGELWTRSVMASTPEDYIQRGWAECLVIIERIEAAVNVMDRKSDPCLTTGAGWIAEEAFATALFCFLMFPHNPSAVIRRAALTSGDSDSIACIAGAFAGAYCGIAGWDQSWVERVEHSERLLKMSTDLYHLNDVTASQ